MKRDSALSRRTLLSGALATLALPRHLRGQQSEIRSEKHCIFCEINAGVRDAAMIYQDELAVVFGSLYAIQPGHALVVPRSHARDLFDLSEKTAGHLLPLAARVGQTLQSVLGADGLTLLQNNGEASGQSVFHFHLHLIPRYGKQEIFQWKKDIPRTSLAEREAILAPVREALFDP